MSLADDLLEQAEHLAGREPRRPKQASLRRAISTAYYALFHLLVGEAVSRVVTGTELRHLVARAFGHTEMKKACQIFARGQLLPHLAAVARSPVPPDLQLVAGTFVALQEARHLADYNTGRRFTRTDVLRHLRDAQDAFRAWDRVKVQPITQVYLVALLVGDRWNRA